MYEDALLSSFSCPLFFGSLLLIGACSGGQTNDSGRTLHTGSDDVNAGDAASSTGASSDESDEDSLPGDEADAASVSCWRERPCGNEGGSTITQLPGWVTAQIGLVNSRST